MQTEPQNKYTFEDWIEDKFWNEKTYSGGYVCNDSENYLELVTNEKMTYEDLNKIQDAQSQAYEYMIQCSLSENEKHFYRQTKGSLDLKKVVELKIKSIEEKIEGNQQLYYDIILPRKHRGIKIGAKFIIPQEFVAFKNRKYSDAFIYKHTSYSIGINNHLVSFPTPEQMKYVQMEVDTLWLKWLSNLLDELKMKEKNLLDLCENNQGYENRILDFHNREVIAGHFLSTQEFVEAEIKEFLEELKQSGGVSIEVNDMPKVTPFNTFAYSKKAYDYLMRGYNLPVKRIIEEARKECEDAKNLQLKQYGRLFAYTPCDGNFERTILTALKTGVGFAMYIKYLRDRSSEQLQNKPAKHQKKKRAGIPTKTRSLLQKEIKSICPFCPSEDVDHFEIHHIDENPSNNIFENLLMVCPTCHSKITKEDITREQVILKKKGLSKQ